MDKYLFCTAGSSGALHYARSLLKHTYTFLPSPSMEATHLLLPVPSLNADGSIVGGPALDEILAQLPKDVTIIGGNLRHPKLAAYQVIDLLQDPLYLAKNANITAHCAILYALKNLNVILDGCPVLILGWGRIGKCLARLLMQMGAAVTVAARKEADRAMICALGFSAIKITAVDEADYKLIYNTVPQMLLPPGSSQAVKIELASVPGMAGSDIIQAKGLPGKHAPESSGKLISETIIRLLKGKDVMI